VLAIMAPVAMRHLAMRQYTARTAVYIDELRRTNARLGEIARCSGTQFDPQIVAILLAIPIEELLAAGQEQHSAGEATGQPNRSRTDRREEHSPLPTGPAGPAGAAPALPRDEPVLASP
jgi:hypothetical protein